MRRPHMQRAYVIFIFALLLASLIVSSDLAVGQLTGSSTVPSGGIIRSGILSNVTKKIQMDFTGAYKTDVNHMTGDGTNYVINTTTPLDPVVGGPLEYTDWTIDPNPPIPSPFSGGAALKMWDVDWTMKCRAEFNIYDMETKVGNEVYYSGWYYFPADWTVGSTSNWYGIADPLERYGGNWAPMIELSIHQGDGGRVPPYSTNPNNFVVSVVADNGSHVQAMMLNSDNTWADYEFTPDQFPRGRWFNIVWWMRRNPTLGESFLNLWFDGVKILNQTAFPYETGPLNKWQRDTSGLNNYFTYEGDPAYTDLVDFGYSYSYYTTFAKDYHGGSSYIHQVWADDAEVWDGKP